MKNKTSLLLMEQLVMILVFAAAAALCLGVLAGSQRIAAETRRLEQGALLAQNAAAMLKNGEDPAGLDTGDLTLDVIPTASPAPGYLETVRIAVGYEGEEIFSLETGWQKEGP